MARSIGPKLKPKPPLEREFNALSYESILPERILDISEVMEKRVRDGICVSLSPVNASLALKGLTRRS